MTKEEYAEEIRYLEEQRLEMKARRQSMIGVITSTKASKSITVLVQRMRYYPKYEKAVLTRKKVMAHDQEETAREGDLVRIAPCRPMSKKKRHKLMDIIRRAPQL